MTWKEPLLYQALLGINVRTKWTVSSHRANKTEPHIKACRRSGPIIHLLTDGDDLIMAPALLMTYTPVMSVLNGSKKTWPFSG